MAKLFKLIIVLALLTGAYLYFSQEEWQAMDTEGLGVSAMAPNFGERDTRTDLDAYLGKYDSEGVTVSVLANKEIFAITKTTSRKISHGQITLSEFENALTKKLAKDFNIRHQSTESITHDGVAGLEIKFMLPDDSTAAYYRAFLNSGAIYNVEIISPENMKNTYRRYRFFKSVKFNE